MKTCELALAMAAGALSLPFLPGCRTIEEPSFATLPPIVRLPPSQDSDADATFAATGAGGVSPPAVETGARAQVVPIAPHPVPASPALETQRAEDAARLTRALSQRANDLRLRVDYLTIAARGAPAATTFETRRRLDELQSTLRDIEGQIAVLRSAGSAETAARTRRELEQSVDRAERLYFDTSSRLASERRLSP